MPRRLPAAHGSWSPTHRLRWTPRAGVVVEWYVQVEKRERDGREITTARSLEEAQEHLPARWELDGEVWMWNGRPGFLGAAGVADLLPLGRR